MTLSSAPDPARIRPPKESSSIGLEGLARSRCSDPPSRTPAPKSRPPTRPRLCSPASLQISSCEELSRPTLAVRPRVPGTQAQHPRAPEDTQTPPPSPPVRRPSMKPTNGRIARVTRAGKSRSRGIIHLHNREPRIRRIETQLLLDSPATKTPPLSHRLSATPRGDRDSRLRRVSRSLL